LNTAGIIKESLISNKKSKKSMKHKLHEDGDEEEPGPAHKTTLTMRKI
jgi:hypothetical protein